MALAMAKRTASACPFTPPPVAFTFTSNWRESRSGPLPGYDRLLEACRRSRTDGRALFPLSSTHVIELFDIASVVQRRDLVAVMEELSGFNYRMGRPQSQQLEVEAALDEIPGVTIAPQSPIPLIGPSLLWAFGKPWRA